MTKTNHITIQCPQCGQIDFEQPKNVIVATLEIMLADLKEAGVKLMVSTHLNRPGKYQAKLVWESETGEKI